MKTLLSALAPLIDGVLSGRDREISAISSRSSECPAGSLFIAVSGAERDGHSFLDDAFAHGAAAAVVERAGPLADRPGIVVGDARRALSTLAALFAGEPASEMRVVALTGTNGKTTTNWLVYHALNRLGLPAVRIGTIGMHAEGVIDLPGVLTTPDPISLHQILSQSAAAGVRACVIEASSHALDQKRVDDLSPDVAVFTNLTRDHLDYHGTMERYLEAKMHLFELLRDGSKATKAAVINIDDPYGRQIAAQFGGALRNFSFGRSADAAVRLESFSAGGNHDHELTLLYSGRRFVIRTPLIGDYNAMNLAAAFASGAGLGFPPELMAEALSGLNAAPGRLERVEGPGFELYVDYAHTPDALERALSALRPATKGDLWAVFGCGGDRDPGKRPIMGEIARRLADKVVVTSDNPRTEDPQKIIGDIMTSGIKPDAVEADRARAIELAVAGASPGDVILIAGKGHEDYQIIGREKRHFSDLEQARAAIQKRMKKSDADNAQSR